MRKAARALRPKHLGSKLAEIRHQLRLSQNELIRRLGFTDLLVREEISAFERGVRVPPVLFLLEIARAANVSVEALIDDTQSLPEILPAGSKGVGGKKTAFKSSSRGRTRKGK
ncbi:MAG TPA: helix-turn-helix transcriptional regulator [Pyrinomonadaceae bacterium]|nr:helix-turn-helix transcriptional regulator [Pyrinomonadaceae bacterium]